MGLSGGLVAQINGVADAAELPDRAGAGDAHEVCQ